MPSKIVEAEAEAEAMLFEMVEAEAEAEAVNSQICLLEAEAEAVLKSSASASLIHTCIHAYIHFRDKAEDTMAVSY